MGDLLQYTDKSIAIDNKLKSLLAQIEYDYRNGNIRTETEYYYKIKKALNDFYKSLSVPAFTFRPAVSTPMSDEYNSMIGEAYSDMEYIIKDCEALSELVSQSFTDAELSRTMLANTLSYLSKKINTIKGSITTNQIEGTIVFTEPFDTFDTFGNLGNKNACRVNTEYGILTLRPKTSNESRIAGIYIDNDVSNGFPGNTHVANTLNGELHFDGQEGLHIDPGAMVDGDIDTWFEFELFTISDKVRQDCNSYGFEYEEGVSWINQGDDPLRFKATITMNSKKECSWIVLAPYLPDIKGVKPCFIEECVVISSSNNAYLIASNRAFDGTLVLPFPPQAIQRIELTLVQPSSYLTKIGHFYYTEVNTSEMSIFQDFDYSESYTRVDGEKPSVGLLGAKYVPSTQWIDYASSDTELALDEYTKDSLFTMPESTLERKSGKELVDAYRYMIGVRKAAVMSCSFYEYGEYVSNAYQTGDVITSITLEADEYIPGNDAEILRYFISLNGGQDWHKIYPIHRAYTGVYKYYVNNDSIENLLSKDIESRKTRNLSYAGNPMSIQVKIEMDRPTDCAYATPIVYSYKLKLTIGGDTIEY